MTFSDSHDQNGFDLFYDEWKRSNLDALVEMSIHQSRAEGMKAFVALPDADRLAWHNQAEQNCGPKEPSYQVPQTPGSFEEIYKDIYAPEYIKPVKELGFLTAVIVKYLGWYGLNLYAIPAVFYFYAAQNPNSDTDYFNFIWLLLTTIGLLYFNFIKVKTLALSYPNLSPYASKQSNVTDSEPLYEEDLSGDVLAQNDASPDQKEDI